MRALNINVKKKKITNSNKQPADLFKEYAEKELKNHLAELRTRYENEPVGGDTLQKGIEEHKTIYSNELDQKIKELTKADSHQDANFSQLKNEYLEKLASGNFRK